MDTDSHQLTVKFIDAEIFLTYQESASDCLLSMEEDA